MIILSFYKACEGGPGQREVLRILKEAGIPAKPASSIYVAHTAVAVLTSNKRLLARAERLVFG